MRLTTQHLPHADHQDLSADDANANADADSVPAMSAAAWPTKRKSRALIATVAVLAIALTPSSACADPGHTVAIADSVSTVLGNIRTWLMGILAGLATVFLTVGGVRYVMAAGDPGEVAKAKIAFKSAGTGYALAALAPLVVTVLQGIVGA